MTIKNIEKFKTHSYKKVAHLVGLYNIIKVYTHIPAQACSRSVTGAWPGDVSEPETCRTPAVPGFGTEAVMQGFRVQRHGELSCGSGRESPQSAGCIFIHTRGRDAAQRRLHPCALPGRMRQQGCIREPGSASGISRWGGQRDVHIRHQFSESDHRGDRNGRLCVFCGLSVVRDQQGQSDDPAVFLPCFFSFSSFISFLVFFSSDLSYKPSCD